MSNKNFEVKHGLSVGGTQRISSAGVGTFTDLNVTGTTTTIDTATLQVQDKNIVINYGSGDTSSTASGAGITIQDAVNSSTDATLLWDASADEFDFSHTVTAPSLTIAGNATFDTSTLVVDSSNNRVGIGTASPSASLHVAHGSDTSDLAQFSGGHASRYLAIRSFQNNSLDGAGFIFNATSSAGAFKFQTATTDRVTIDSSGRVGIGTSSPDSKLHVDSGVSSTSDWGNLGIISDFPINNTGRIYTSYLLQDTESIKAAGIGLAYDGTGYKMHFGTASTTSSGLSTAATIDRAGNVGIGTQTPGQNLTVSSSGVTYSRVATTSSTSAAVQEVVNSDSNGISMISYSASAAGTYFGSNRASTTIFDSNQDTLIGTSGSKFLSFATNSTERMRINSDGYVTLSRVGGDYGLQIRSSATRSGLVIDKPGTTTIMGSALVLADESYRLGTASYYHIEMTQDGDTKINNHLLLTNEFGLRAYSGYFAAGTTTGNFDFNTYSAGCYEVTAAFGHYGFINSYGCFKKAICSNGSGYNGSASITVIDIATEITTGNGGSWTFGGFSSGSNQTSHIRVSKNAGTYAGGGYYFVEVRGNQGS